MVSNAQITLNLQYPNIARVVYAMQGDRLSRSVVASLVDGDTPWTPPAGATGLITGEKPDGTIVVYDTLEDGSAAVVINGSTATFYLAEQLLTAAGRAKLTLSFFNGAGSRLTAFRITLVIAPQVVLDNVISGNYISVFTATLAEAQQMFEQIKAGYGAPLTASSAAAMTDTNRVYVYIGTTSGSLTNGHWYYWDGSAWADGGNYNSTGFTTDTTLSVAGAAADAKATGDAVGDLKSALNGINEFVYEIGNVKYTAHIKGKYCRYTQSGQVAPGDLLASINGVYTELLPINGAKYVEVYSAGSVGCAVIAFYDQSQTYISGVVGAGQTVEQTFSSDIPTTAEYVRFSGFSNEINVSNIFKYQIGAGADDIFASVDEITANVDKIETNIDSLTLSAVNIDWENGTLSTSTGMEGDNDSYIRTPYIETKDATELSLTVANESAFRYVPYVFRYFDDGSFNYVRSDVSLRPGDTYTVEVSDAIDMRCVVARQPASTDISPEIDSLNLLIETRISPAKLSKKTDFKNYTADYIRFSVSVNTQFPVDGSGTATLDGETMQDIPCILKLPPNYDPFGDPVPLIMFSHGTGSYVTDDSPTSQINNYFTYVGDGKCAVFDCNGMVPNSGPVEGMNMGGPIAVQAFHKAYEYITANYNVRKDLIIGGNSMGGLAALNFINSYPDLVRCAVLAYPVTGLKTQAWDDPWRTEVHEAIALAYGFADASGETWEAEKVIGYNPERNKAVVVDGANSIFISIPVKIWHGTADTVVSYQGSVDYIASVQNAGVPAYLRPVEGGTHGATIVTNAFYRESKYFIRRYL